MDFQYRKLAPKPKGTLGKRLVADIDLESTSAKRQKLTSDVTEWFHNYQPFSDENLVVPAKKLAVKQELSDLVPLSRANNVQNSTTVKKETVKTQKKPPTFSVFKDEGDEANPFNVMPSPKKKVNRRVLKDSTNKNNARSPRVTAKKRPVRALKAELVDEDSFTQFTFNGLEIFDGVFVGGERVASNQELLRKYNILSVVNATKEISNFFETDAENQEETGTNYSYFKIPVADSMDAPLSKYFDKSSEFIAEQLKKSNVLVHCKMGQSRSPSVIIAYAMKSLGLSLQEVWTHITNKHENMKINEGFKMQLMEYEKKVSGKSTLDFYQKRSCRQRANPRLRV